MTTTLDMHSPSNPVANGADRLLQLCLERSSRGVASRADWQHLARLDPDLAREALRRHLQQDAPVVPTDRNPYAKNALRPGVAVGFVCGAIAMSIIWLAMHWIQGTYVTSGEWFSRTTLVQYVAALLIPIGAWVGWRFDQHRHAPTGSRERVSIRNAEWDELLDRFEATQRSRRTRVY